MWYTISKQTDNAFLTVTKKCSKTFTNAFSIMRALFCIFTTSSLLPSYLIWTNFSYSCAALLTGGCLLSNSSLFFTYIQKHILIKCTHPLSFLSVVETSKTSCNSCICPRTEQQHKDKCWFTDSRIWWLISVFSLCFLSS